jgi:hypothetical protein
MRRILRSGELWGRPPHNSDIPAVQAFFGELPNEVAGFEFFAACPPDRGAGPVAYWRVRDDGSVWGEDDWAKVRVVVSHVSQDLDES